MSASQTPATPADREAAEWFARLSATSVSTEALHDFFEWRKAPENAAAYKRQEQNWDRFARLKGDPEIDAMLSAAGQPKPRTGPSGRLVLSGVVALLIAGLGVGVYWTLNAASTYGTQVGEQRSVQLADGSVVRLDTNSRIRVRLSGSERQIDLLEGQALFEVAHDASRPFRVHADAMTVTALGTVFDVRLDGGSARVVLVEGKVKVEAPGGSDQVLLPNQTARTSGQGAKTQLIDAAVATSWAEGRLIFSNTPLQAAVAEVNRYLTDKIEIDAPGTVQTPISGVFRAGDRAAFVSAASDVFELEAVAQPGGAIKLVPRRTKNP
jgi:transmembrane sensor